VKRERKRKEEEKEGREKKRGGNEKEREGEGGMTIGFSFPKVNFQCDVAECNPNQSNQI